MNAKSVLVQSLLLVTDPGKISIAKAGVGAHSEEKLVSNQLNTIRHRFLFKLKIPHV